MSENTQDLEKKEETPLKEQTSTEVVSETTTDTSAVKVKRGKTQASPYGQCTVLASFNNTIVTIINVNGETVSWSSAGCVGIKGSRKSTPFAAQLAAERAAQKALELGVKKLDVRVKGAGPGRESAVRSLKMTGLDILSIQDVTGVPHNGCRPKKKRRI